MSKLPTLEEIVQVVECLPVRRRMESSPEAQTHFSDSFIIALAVFQKLASFRHAQQMLAVLEVLGVDVPASSTFSERKTQLLGRLILAVKQLCSRMRATRQHLDPKKLEVVDFVRARGTKLAGAYGRDHIHSTTFYGFRLHARVDDSGQLCRVLLRPANEYDVKIAPRLLADLSYSIITADKGYISRAFKVDLAKSAVDLVTPRKSNQLAPPQREKLLYQGHRMIETTFSSLDRLGLSDRPYRSTIGLLMHGYANILAYQLTRSKVLRPLILVFRIEVYNSVIILLEKCYGCCHMRVAIPIGVYRIAISRGKMSKSKKSDHQPYGYSAVFLCRGAPGLGRVSPSVALAESWSKTALTRYLFVSYLTGARYLRSVGHPVVDLGEYINFDVVEGPYVEEIPEVLLQSLSLIENFKPDVVVIDGMLYAPLLIKELGIPVVSIANLKYLQDKNNPGYLVEQALHNVADLVIAQDLRWEYAEEPFSFTTTKNLILVPPIVKEANQTEIFRSERIQRPHVVISLGGGAVRLSHAYQVATQQLSNNLLKALGEICQDGFVKSVTVVPCYGIETLQAALPPSFNVLEAPVELVNIFQECDIVITRGGRNTVAEILSHGSRGIVFPRTDAYAYEQQSNAKTIESFPNFEVMSENEISTDSLWRTVEVLLARPDAVLHNNVTPGNEKAIELIESVIKDQRKHNL